MSVYLLMFLVIFLLTVFSMQRHQCIKKKRDPLQTERKVKAMFLKLTNR